ncbi:MAG TPA: thiamine-phosphate kinase, partial [Planctomycetes bacterium]|nr:thiamine-phosphate kinase [Planctomycetota bacterium]
MVKVLGENELLPIFQSSFNRRKGLSPPGDDCAVLVPPQGRRLVQTCDQLVEGVHVPTGCHPEQMAVKLVRRSLSDLAAAGAEPWAA